MMTRPAQTRSQPRPLQAESTGTPQALSSLARMLLKLHTRPALHLVPADEQPRDPVPSQLERQV